MEAHAGGLEAADLALDIPGEDGDVGRTGHRRVAGIRLGRRLHVLDELHAGATQFHVGDEDLGAAILPRLRPEQGRPQISGLPVLATYQPHAHHVLVEVHGPLEVGNGEAHMVDSGDRHGMQGSWRPGLAGQRMPES